MVTLTLSLMNLDEMGKTAEDNSGEISMISGVTDDSRNNTKRNYLNTEEGWELRSSIGGHLVDKLENTRKCILCNSNTRKFCKACYAKTKVHFPVCDTISVTDNGRACIKTCFEIMHERKKLTSLKEQRKKKITEAQKIANESNGRISAEKRKGKKRTRSEREDGTNSDDEFGHELDRVLEEMTEV
jgi:hypothetical protein